MALEAEYLNASNKRSLLLNAPSNKRLPLKGQNLNKRPLY